MQTIALIFTPVRKTFLFGALWTCVYLIGLPILGMAITVLISERLIGHIRDAALSTAIQIALLAFLFWGGGILWARITIRHVGRSPSKRVIFQTGAGYLLLVLSSGIILALLERKFVEQNVIPEIPIHNIFTILFTSTAALISGSAVFLLLIALLQPSTAFAVAWRCSLVSAAAFFITNRLMHNLGWVVGAPDAAARATMLVVMMCGFLASAAFGGGLSLVKLTQAVKIEDSSA